MKTFQTLLIAGALSLAPLTAMAAPGTPATAEAAAGETVTAKVNGLVCDFCAQSIRKTFGKEDAVQKVHVDLSKGEFHLGLKPGKTMDDAAIEKLIRKSGYSLVSIERVVAK